MSSLPESLPDVIRSQHDTVRFCFWLGDHPEITQVQGWEIERYESNTMPCRFGTHFAVVEWMWSERAALNDWIRTYWERVI